MNDAQIILGLDIGSSKICAALAEVLPDGEYRIKGIGTSISGGVERGKIVDEEELYVAIQRALSRATLDTRHRPTTVLTTVPFDHIRIVQNAAVITSTARSEFLEQEDYEQVLSQVKSVVKDNREQLLHVIPTEYRVDHVAVAHPVGAKGQVLELDATLVLGCSRNVTLLTRVLRRCGLYVSGLIYEPLASSQVLLARAERETAAYVLDIGGEFSKLSFFNAGVLWGGCVLACGGDTITADIAMCLDVSVPEAERLKLIYCDLTPDRRIKDDEIEINTVTSGRKRLKVSLLGQIVSARVNEIVKLLFQNFEAKYGHVPGTYGNLVLSGAGALVSGISPYIAKQFQLKVRDGVPAEHRALVESVGYSAAIGAVLYGIKQSAVPLSGTDSVRSRSVLMKWLRGFFKPVFSV